MLKDDLWLVIEKRRAQINERSGLRKTGITESIGGARWVKFMLITNHQSPIPNRKLSLVVARSRLLSPDFQL
jgi:hypothetical protein